MGCGEGEGGTSVPVGHSSYFVFICRVRTRLIAGRPFTGHVIGLGLIRREPSAGLPPIDAPALILSALSADAERPGL